MTKAIWVVDANTGFGSETAAMRTLFSLLQYLPLFLLRGCCHSGTEDSLRNLRCHARIASSPISRWQQATIIAKRM